MKPLDQILLEVTLGRPPATPDTPEEAALRAQLQQEVDAIAASGGTVEIPSELPITTDDDR